MSPTSFSHVKWFLVLSHAFSEIKRRISLFNEKWARNMFQVANSNENVFFVGFFRNLFKFSNDFPITHRERETHNLRWSTDIKTYCSVIHTKIILFWINSAPILRRQLIFFLFLLGVCLIESIPYKLHFHAKTVKIILSEIVLVAKLSRQCHSRHSMRYSIVTMAIDLIASVQRNLQWSKHPKKVFWDTKTHSRYGFLTFENH